MFLNLAYLDYPRRYKIILGDQKCRVKSKSSADIKHHSGAPIVTICCILLRTMLLHQEEWIAPLVAGFLCLDELTRLAMCSRVLWGNAGLHDVYFDQEAEMKAWISPDGYLTTALTTYIEAEWKLLQYLYSDEDDVCCESDLESEASFAWDEVRCAVQQLTGKPLACGSLLRMHKLMLEGQLCVQDMYYSCQEKKSSSAFKPAVGVLEKTTTGRFELPRALHNTLAEYRLDHSAMSSFQRTTLQSYVLRDGFSFTKSQN